jgi:cytochrome c oxidase assembly protein Cox11
MRNNSGQSVVGQAIPRYLPAEAAAYVKKLECFCFRQQAFQPGETALSGGVADRPPTARRHRQHHAGL